MTFPKWSNPWLLRRLGVLVLAVAVALLLRRYYVEAFKIPAGSMIPTLQIEDHVFVDKTGWQPRRGDVVVFIFPVEPDKDFVKRVIGLPGDRIAIDEHRVSVNGRTLGGKLSDEPCSYQDYDEPSGAWRDHRCRFLDEEFDGKRWRVIHDYDFSGTRKNGDFVVKPGELFMLGDNRDNSYDSRFWGGVPLANVKGRACVIWNRRTGQTWTPIP